jgi:hypothetical protein
LTLAVQGKMDVLKINGYDDDDDVYSLKYGIQLHITEHFTNLAV